MNDVTMKNDVCPCGAPCKLTNKIKKDFYCDDCFEEKTKYVRYEDKWTRSSKENRISKFKDRYDY